MQENKISHLSAMEGCSHKLWRWERKQYCLLVCVGPTDRWNTVAVYAHNVIDSRPRDSCSDTQMHCADVPMSTHVTHTHSQINRRIRCYSQIYTHLHTVCWNWLKMQHLCKDAHREMPTYTFEPPAPQHTNTHFPGCTFPLLRWSHSSIRSPSLSSYRFIYLFTGSRAVCFLSKTNWKE